jgi:hypothetical protein
VFLAGGNPKIEPSNIVLRGNLFEPSEILKVLYKVKMFFLLENDTRSNLNFHFATFASSVPNKNAAKTHDFATFGKSKKLRDFEF